MKTKLLTVIGTVALSLTFVSSSNAALERDPVAVTADVLVARPLCLAATIIGGAIFVVSLPVAAASGSVDSAADALVMKPAWATFQRPLGDFGYSEDYAVKHPGKQERHRMAHSRKKAATSPKQ